MDLKCMNDNGDSLLLHEFKNKDLFNEAMTHKSWLHENQNSSIQSYERLEYLGDAVLKAIHATYLYERYPKSKESFLTNSRHFLENNKELYKMTIHIGLDKYIRTGGCVKKNSKCWRKICADVFEAYIGAIWKDSNYDFNLIHQYFLTWRKDFSDEGDEEIQEIFNPKRELQEFLQYLFPSLKPTCKYSVISQKGPVHKPIITVLCTICINDINPNFVICNGGSVRGAEVQCAIKWLDILSKHEKYKQLLDLFTTKDTL
jgi:ribonuclease III